MPTLAYISGIKTATFDYATDGDTFLVECSNHRFMQQLAAMDSFFWAERGRFDTVLVIGKKLCKAQLRNKKTFVAG